MPRLQRRRQNRRGLDWNDLTIADITSLRIAWSPTDTRRNGTAFPDRESLEAFYHDHADELEELVLRRDDPVWLRGRQPGCFNFVSWYFRLLPEEPRLRVDPDEPDETSDRKPCSHPCWDARDGFESSFDYLARRELLEPGEVEAIRRMHGLKLETDLKRVREGNPHACANRPWELATISRIFGEDILTADELSLAEPFLS